MTQQAPTEAQEDPFLAFLMDQGYLAARQLPDGSYAALVRLMFTVAIIVGVTRDSYEARFCFDDRLKALEQFAALQTEDDVPEGFIARR